MMLLDQRLVFRLHGFQRRIGAQPHHLQRLALCIEHLSGFDLGLGAGARPPAAAPVELAKHTERIGRPFQVGFGAALALLGTGVGAHLPGRSVTGQCVFLDRNHCDRALGQSQRSGVVTKSHVCQREVSHQNKVFRLFF